MGLFAGAVTACALALLGWLVYVARSRRTRAREPVLPGPTPEPPLSRRRVLSPPVVGLSRPFRPTPEQVALARRASAEERATTTSATTGHCLGAECFRGAPEVDVCACPCDACRRAREALLRRQGE
jgi:hypothetical protein